MKDTGEGVSFTFQFRKCDRSSYYIWCIWYVSEVCFCVSRCIRNKHLTKWFHAIGQKSWFKHAWPCALEQESLVFLIIVIVLKIVLSKRINSILNQISTHSQEKNMVFARCSCRCHWFMNIGKISLFFRCSSGGRVFSSFVLC